MNNCIKFACAVAITAVIFFIAVTLVEIFSGTFLRVVLASFGLFFSLGLCKELCEKANFYEYE